MPQLRWKEYNKKNDDKNKISIKIQVKSDNNENSENATAKIK